MNGKNVMDMYQNHGGENNMETPPISDETREKLEEATLSVFMDQYAKALDAGIDSLMEECAEDAFPPELDARIQKLIAKESTKERNKKRRKTALRVLRSAAAVVIVFLSVCSVLFMTVEAFRVPVMNFFVEKTEHYWEISTENQEKDIPATFNEEDPLDGILSDEFELVYLDGSLQKDSLAADYIDSRHQRMVSLFIISSGGYNQTDTEEADASRFNLAGQDAMISIEGDVIRITWIDHDISKVFTIRATNISEDEVLSVSTQLAKMF